MKFKIKYLNAKIITALIISLATGFFILSAFQIHQQKKDMLLDFTTNVTSITSMLDKQLSDGVRTKNSDNIKLSYKDLVEDPNSIVSAITIYDTANNQLSSYESSNFPKADLASLWNNFKNIDQNTTKFDLPDHYVLIKEIKADNNVVGYLEISWSKENVLGKVSESASNLLWVVIVMQSFMIILLGTLLRIIVTKPIIKITHAMNELASGVTNIEIPFLTRDDEIGRMAYALNIFKDNVIKSIELEKEADAKEKLHRQEIIDKIIGGFQKKIVRSFEALSSSCMGLDSISDSMKNTVMVSSEKSVRTVDNADKMNQETQMVASAIVQMSSSIQDINRNMMSSNESFVDAVKKTEAIDKIIQELINETQKITTIIEAIDNISKHVKLLSLNAAIEAERAGEYGKGFAVVATEIKDLACQTEESTKNIYVQVRAIDKASMNVVTYLNPVKTSVNLIKDVFNQIASAIKEQEMATKEMSKTMDSFATSVKEVSSDVRDVGDSFGDVEGASEQLNDAVQIISELSTSLDSEVKTFFQTIKDTV